MIIADTGFFLALFNASDNYHQQALSVFVAVLSPGTEASDRGNKFRMYRQNHDLQEYILVDSN
jgi:Uma2 family endonuclease